jgi:hypothetical protein
MTDIEEKQLSLIKKNPYNIWKLLYYEKNGGDKVSENVKLAAVELNGLTIEFIEKPSFEIQRKAIVQNPWSIIYIEKPDDIIALIAIIFDPSLLKRRQKRYIEEKLPFDYFMTLSLKIQKKLIEHNPLFSAIIPNLHPSLVDSIKRLSDIGII